MSADTERAGHDRVCTANRSNGEKCRAFAIVGGRVCRVHGGAAPQVKRRAAEVVAEARERMHVQLLPLAVQRLYEIVNDKKLPAADRLRAATSILDRTGLGPGSTVQIDQTVHVLPPAEIFIEAITGARDRLTKAGIVRYADAEFVQPGEVDPEPDATELDGPDAEVLAFPVPDFI